MFGLLRYAFRFFAYKGTAFVVFWQETCWFLLVLLQLATKSTSNFSPYLEVLRNPVSPKRSYSWIMVGIQKSGGQLNYCSAFYT